MIIAISQPWAEFLMIKSLKSNVTTLHALIFVLIAKFAEIRNSANMLRRRELLVDIDLIGERIGPDVVKHVGLLVARGRDVSITFYDGTGCSKSGLKINTYLEQLIRMRGLAICPHCEELLICSDQYKAVAVHV